MKHTSHNQKSAAHPRSAALKKLLALGDLPLCDVLEIMGGDRAEVNAAVIGMVESGEVKFSNNWMCYRLNSDAKWNAHGVKNYQSMSSGTLRAG